MHVSKLIIYPIKSLDGVEVREAEITAMGTLRHDRRWALADAEGNFVNSKRTEALHQVRASFASDISTVALSRPGGMDAVLPLAETGLIEAWFSDYLGYKVQLMEDAQQGFPDDLHSNGPTLISEATLKEVGQWFDLSLDAVRRRFRTNIEIQGCEPFWEDQLFGPTSKEPKAFQIGGVEIWGMNPCQRCAVPSRDPITGETTPSFQKSFIAKRQETLPPWARSPQFNHFYRLAINTRIPPSQAGTRIYEGTDLQLTP
ncbi:MAG: MOSC domain-containing protein [Verrucomicrobia bacterium]|nr:MOSC domain-containing protein [Verrucomicrobiota bacterium]